MFLKYEALNTQTIIVSYEQFCTLRAIFTFTSSKAVAALCCNHFDCFRLLSMDYYFLHIGTIIFLSFMGYTEI